jgi:prepilin-type N-terminal cleavage/methylation domain-containing protein
MDGRHPSRVGWQGGGGFTLIEVLIAVTVLSVGIVLILQGMHAVMYAWEGGVARMRGAMEAQEALAQVVLAADAGEAPDSSSAILEVEDNFEGHAGLYRVVYKGGTATESSFPLETLVYVPSVRGEKP